MNPSALIAALLGLTLTPVTGIAADISERSTVSLERVIGAEGDVKTGIVSKVSRAIHGDNPSLFERPYGVFWQGDALLVTDPGRGSLVRIDSARRRVERSPVEFGEPIAVQACLGGLAVSDSAAGTVTLLRSDLQLDRILASGLSRPTGLACLGDTLAVSETGAHRIALIERDGNIRRFGGRGPAPGEFNFPTMLAAREGRLYVCDSMNFRVQIVDPSGRPLGAFGQLGDRAGTMPRLKGIAVDARGHVWLADGALDELAVYDSNGEFLLRVGSPGEKGGAFTFPAGIAFRDDGVLAVADSLNRRVQILRVSGGGRP